MSRRAKRGILSSLNQMRVLFVSHSAGTGGAERVLLETIELLQTQGTECRVLLPEKGPFCEHLEALRVPYSVISYPMWMARGEISTFVRIKSALNILKDTVQVGSCILRWKCELVYSNTIASSVGALASWLVKVPHVWHLHEFGFEDQGLRFLFGERTSIAAISRLSSRCVLVSHALAGKYSRFIDPSKISVVYPSMHRALSAPESLRPEQDRIPPTTGRFRCVIVGALIEGKGQRDAVLALPHLKKSGMAVELLIVGQGEAGYRSSLEELISKNNLNQEVSFIPQVSNSLPVMRSADVVLVCSRSEAFGRVTIEGMSSGTPVIGARAAATAELIKDGETGLLYRQGDPADLAAKIEFVYRNPDRAKELGKNAQSWVATHFTRDRYTKELMAVLNVVCPRMAERNSAEEIPSNEPARLATRS